MIKAPTSFIQRLKFIGPSIIVTGSVVGSGSIALSPLLGAATGFALLWWLLLSLWSKPLIQAEISRYVIATNQTFRSEERRVGKECRSRWSPYH